MLVGLIDEKDCGKHGLPVNVFGYGRHRFCEVIVERLPDLPLEKMYIPHVAKLVAAEMSRLGYAYEKVYAAVALGPARLSSIDAEHRELGFEPVIVESGRVATSRVALVVISPDAAGFAVIEYTVASGKLSMRGIRTVSLPLVADDYMDAISADITARHAEK